MSFYAYPGRHLGWSKGRGRGHAWGRKKKWRGRGRDDDDKKWKKVKRRLPNGNIVTQMVPIPVQAIPIQQPIIIQAQPFPTPVNPYQNFLTGRFYPHRPLYPHYFPPSPGLYIPPPTNGGIGRDPTWGQQRLPVDWNWINFGFNRPGSGRIMNPHSNPNWNHHSMAGAAVLDDSLLY